MAGLRNFVIGPSLTLLSLLILIVGLEIFLRLTIEDSQADPLYVGLTYSRSRDTEYFQRSFLDLYPHGKDWKRGVYDPYLGWDHNVDNGRTRGRDIYPLQPDEDIYRVVSIGDSFVFGSFVNDGQTYPSYLESMLDSSEVLNMGGVGYGIDQAVLKYLKYGSQYQPDLVTLGTFPHDYVRTGLSFYGYSKPVFEYNRDTNSVELTNTNIPPPDQVFADLKRELKTPVLYSYTFLENLLIRAYWKLMGSGAKERYYQEMDIILEHILSMLVDSTQLTNTKLLIVEVPHGNSFRDQEALSAAKTDDAHEHLIDIYEKLQIPHIDLLEEFESGYSLDEVFNEFYIHVTDTTRGHFTPEGNLEVAKIIKKKLDDL